MTSDELFSSRAGGLTDQVVAELVQVTAEGVPPVPLAEHVAQPVGLAQPGGGTEEMADRDRARAPQRGPGGPGRR